MGGTAEGVWETGVFWNEKGVPGASYLAWSGAVTKFSWKMEGEGRGNEIFMKKCRQHSSLAAASTAARHPGASSAACALASWAPLHNEPGEMRRRSAKVLVVELGVGSWPSTPPPLGERLVAGAPAA